MPRLQGLEAVGLEVHPFDTTDWAGAGPRLWSALAYRCYATPSVFRFNAALLRAAAEQKPDVLWIEKGTWLFPRTLQRLRERCRFLVHYNTDDLFSHANWFWLLRQGLRRFDLHLTTNRFNVKEIADYSGRAVLRVGMGFDSETHRPVPPERRIGPSGGIVFVGHWEKHTESYLMALRDAGLPVSVWGSGWKRAASLEFRAVASIPQELYSPTIAGADLALCSLSRENRNESTGRSFEIPAIGTCMLAERTGEHEFLFRDGVEALLFSTPAELVEKARHYLENAEERRAIAKRGFERCQTLRLSWQGHMEREWPLVEAMLLENADPRSGADDAPFWSGYRKGEPFAGNELTAERSPVLHATVGRA